VICSGDRLRLPLPAPAQQSRRHTRTDGLAFTSSAPYRFAPTRTSQGASNRPKENIPHSTGVKRGDPIRPPKRTLNALARKPVCATMELDMPTSRFPPPWSVDELEACFVVKDGAGPKAGVYLLRGRTGATFVGQAAHQRRGAKDCGQHGEVAALVARLLERPRNQAARRIAPNIAKMRGWCHE
jgi:hypothetical protein